MKTHRKKSFLTGIPSWALALIAMVCTTILMFVIGEGLGPLINIEGELIESSPYIIYGVIISICCFFIVRQNPKSIWYVPLICNALLIFSAIIEPNFWTTSMWIPVSGGWVLSLIASITGALVGKRTTNSNNSQNSLLEG